MVMMVMMMMMMMMMTTTMAADEYLFIVSILGNENQDAVWSSLRNNMYLDQPSHTGSPGIHEDQTPEMFSIFINNAPSATVLYWDLQRRYHRQT